MKNPKKLPLTKHWKIHLILLALGIFIGLVSSQFSASIIGSIGMIIGFILVILGFAWQILFLKCPHCGYGFHLKRPIANHCPNCGEKIN